MSIRAVVFDIGGVLEITPRTGWEARWEGRLQLEPGGLVEQLRSVWLDGDVGTITEEEIEKRTGEILGLDQAQLDEFMNDLWDEYLGTLNIELATYFAALRPRYQTAIISNSFVGAREKEQEHYGFSDICDLIVYSHEVGIKKPNPRIFELACERLGIEPSEMVFLDDFEEAVKTARQLGIHGIIFRDNAQAIADIEALLMVDHEKILPTKDNEQR